jgi:ribonuclease P protein subunit RPR2
MVADIMSRTSKNEHGKVKQKTKGKPKAGGPRNPHRAAQARISFLFQASQYLSAQSESVEESASHTEQEVYAGISENLPPKRDTANLKHPRSTNDVGGDLSLLKRHALPAYLANHMFSVRLKCQVRIDQDLKRRICKRCKIVLIEGKTSTTVVENKSRKSKKPWADVTVVSCLACGMQKRYPVGIKKPRSMESASEEIEGSD